MDTPKNWLPSFDPGISLPKGDLSYVTDKLIPYLITVFLFILMVLSVFFLLIGGVRWIASSGDKEALAKAKGTVTFAIIGLVLGLGSFIILNILAKVFNLGSF